jgi:hypothetical protein
MSTSSRDRVLKSLGKKQRWTLSYVCILPAQANKVACYLGASVACRKEGGLGAVFSWFDSMSEG